MRDQPQELAQRLRASEIGPAFEGLSCCSRLRRFSNMGYPVTLSLFTQQWLCASSIDNVCHLAVGI